MKYIGKVLLSVGKLNIPSRSNEDVYGIHGSKHFVKVTVFTW